jgi:hypothetical protein
MARRPSGLEARYSVMRRTVSGAKRSITLFFSWVSLSMMMTQNEMR